ncbi:Nif3-like dinuclear metal center hexameric protein [Candidatus Schneideria nysicola]|uniref:Nif3-like dinuclear metal center hexameric protein n=1 Tax=Candidatus Schneideria nysicola TaxID=1081631 RepID=UPI001CAA7353|nr:Nif3-like dinuclear metal center hexameric protein [Candidatus Schneideria nysicola]UAJ66210.1 Nif3-like dinuclear metal center hexameric protein [Candidatus Schneideria nysicola]
MNNFKLENIINQKLNSQTIQDFVPNGLQVEGKEEVNNIILGVTACQKLLNYALEKNADAIIVHHGFFWKKESPVIHNMKRQRLKTILCNDINLYAWHLPLDIHPSLGNNITLANILNIKPISPNFSFPFFLGNFEKPIIGEVLRSKLTQILNRNVLYYHGDHALDSIKTIALCSGSGQQFIEQAVKLGIDAFISGELSEPTIHIVREMNIHFYVAGHHATERGGIQSLGDWLNKKFNLNTHFIDIENPA